MGTTTGCVSFIIIDKNGRLAFRLTADRNENPVNSGYKSRAAPGMRNRAPYPDQGIYTPGRRSGDKRWRSRSPGINIEDAMPEATALRRDHEETALIAVQKNCRALFEQQSHRAAGDDIGARINISQSRYFDVCRNGVEGSSP